MKHGFWTDITARFPALLLLLALLFPSVSAWGDEPMPPEKAFAMTARALDAGTLEITFNIAKNYYLYGDKFAFSAEPEIAFGEPRRAAGKMKDDPYFGRVEVLRGKLRILLPMILPEGVAEFQLTAASQGCWDGGICYPVTEQTADIALGAQGGSLLERALSRGNTGSETADEATFSDDEAGRIARFVAEEGLLIVLITVFGLGLSLAFTGCVYPMIPILSGIIVGQGHNISKWRAFMLSLAYVLGVAVIYAAAGVIAGLTGTLLSTVLQNVWVLSAFALVFVALALSMFGFYEIKVPAALLSRLNNTANRTKGGHLLGVALMGMASALIVSPCVAAPLAGILLYIAQTGDALLGGTALFVMALGLGTPLLVIAVFARSVLPSPGPWMKSVQYGVGVVLLGVALWIASPMLPALLTMLGWATLLIFSGVYMRALDALPPQTNNWHRFWKGVGLMLLIAGACVLVGAISGATDPLRPLERLTDPGQTAARAHHSFEQIASSAELDALLAASDRPVMLDFYADWCTSCKEMERKTFSDPQVAEKMAQLRLLQADVTDNSTEHAALLKRFGLFGPPGILFFDRSGNEIKSLRVIGYMDRSKFLAVLDRALAS